MSHIRLLLAGLLLLASAPAAWSQASRPGGLPADSRSGELKLIAIGGEQPQQPMSLPLKHTDVRISISGFVARATVTQHYTNPFETPIEALYVFPLPNNAAVDSMTMHVGERIIRGVIKKKEEAREIYRQAKAAGQRASLLEQERPNIFTQAVANIMPGDDIKIEITYVDLLDFRDEGAYELVFPMVVGPRYIPGDKIGKTANGWSPDTDQVPDASRITPPVLKPGQRSGHDISLSVALDAGLSIEGVHSVSHAVDIDEISDSQRRIRLHASDTLPNKDFILRYKVAGDVPKMTLISHHSDAQGGYFTFIALPQQQVGEEEAVPRDLIFILDTSGSMRGFPLDKAKQAMYRLIDGMRPSDRFNVVRFAGDSGTLWADPQAKTPANVAAAKRYIDSLRGSGGTEMRKGIDAALRQASDSDRLRIAFLLTDGYVGNENGILNSIEKERRGARIFTLGVGSSINRYLLDRAANVGRGEAFYVRQDGNADEVIDRFFQRVDRPALAHLDIDWNGLDVSELTPARIPDLWQGQPIVLHGRYKKGGAADIRISGRLGSQPYGRTLHVELPQHQPEHAVMASVWARAQVKQLMLDMARKGQSAERVEKITQLGLDYSLMTQWTSFVAVEEKVVNEGGRQQTIMQPVEMPEGVDYDGVFGQAQDAAVPMPKSVGALRFKAMAPPPLAYPTPALAPAAGLSVTPQATTRINRLGQSQSGLLNRQEANFGRVEMKEERAERAAVTPENCQRQALSVSGGLKYPQVEQTLKAAWSQLCREAQGKYNTPTRFDVELHIAADGAVSKVLLTHQGKVSDALFNSVRDWFRKLQFGAVAGSQAKVKLRLLLQP